MTIAAGSSALYMFISNTPFLLIHDFGLRPREVAQGWMLPCCSKPMSDLELDR